MIVALRLFARLQCDSGLYTDDCITIFSLVRQPLFRSIAIAANH